MKVIFLFNFYNSFRSIVENNEFTTVGNISLIRIIKKISLNNFVQIYLLEKNKNSKINKITKTKINNIEFKVIPLNNKYNILKNIPIMLKEFLLSCPKTFYIDRGNIIFAYILKVLTKHKVIIRILGITQVIEESLIGFSLRNYFNRIFWKKRYDLVINSNDGSNYKKFYLNNMSSKNIYLTLNQAVDKFHKIKTIRKKFNILLCDNFKSIYKNFSEILETLNFINPDIKKKIKLIFIYSDKNEKLKIKKNTISFNDIKLIPRQDNKKLLNHKFNCDALITFNSMGYLSNNICESIYCNNWIITPYYSKIAANIPTKLKKNFVFINKKNLKIELNRTISKLLNESKNLQFKNILTNQNKIEKEINFLKTTKLIN
tara:strand:+ start:1098 stop:2219 length:1122 start_codon:yes stop_codon:yes gene_type:complete